VEKGWNKTDNSEKLTAAEIGKLWATYMGNSMGIRILSYFLNNVEDTEIRLVLEKALRLSEQFTQNIHNIFSREHYPIPIGFTEKDVDINAPRLFEDEFYVYYMQYAGKAGISLYGTAVPLMTRPDIRAFFTSCLDSTVDLLNNVNDVMAAKGFLIKPPYIPEAKHVDFIKKQSYLNGFFGDVRPLQSLEITHLYENVLHNAIGKAISTGFSQVAKLDQVKNYFIRTKNLTSKHIEFFSGKLQKEDLPSHPPLNHLITNSTNPPFSDKLMLFHKIDMLLVRIRTYGNALSFCSRHDLTATLGRCLLEVGNCAEDGANIMIDLSWFEQPPQAVDRDALARTR
jgi:hypothetical protein